MANQKQPLYHHMDKVWCQEDDLSQILCHRLTILPSFELYEPWLGGNLSQEDNLPQILCHRLTIHPGHNATENGNNIYYRKQPLYYHRDKVKKA